jgi:glycosyltransferase involved in cell wall biosynthesis
MVDDASLRPQVSAIIVVHNGEPYIREAIDSILHQTLTDWELLVVDDASTDGTAAIVRGYERSLPDKVRLLFHPDGQNHGIRSARQLYRIS